jgi:hypothetical protein
MARLIVILLLLTSCTHDKGSNPMQISITKNL